MEDMTIGYIATLLFLGGMTYLYFENTKKD